MNYNLLTALAQWVREMLCRVPLLRAMLLYHRNKTLPQNIRLFLQLRNLSMQYTTGEKPWDHLSRYRRVSYPTRNRKELP